jgi:hypothetical protein
MLRLWSHQWDRGLDRAGKNLVNYILSILITDMYSSSGVLEKEKVLRCSIRFGNTLLFDDHSLRTITSFAQLSI